MINLENKTVVITGGGSGVGQTIVKIFAKAKANVAFTYCSSTEKAEQLVSELNVEYYDISTYSELIKFLHESNINNFIS